MKAAELISKQSVCPDVQASAWKREGFWGVFFLVWWCSVLFVFFLILTWGFVFIDLRERERERNIVVRENHRSVAGA